MTEEQKKKCEEIYKLYELNYRNSGIIKNIAKFILISFGIMPVFYLNRYGSGWIKIAMLLSKVFNKNITKKEAEKIIDIFYKNQINPLYRNRIIIPIRILMNQSNYRYIFWKIANYFDEEQKNNEDFISKEFIVKNYLGFDVNPWYEIIIFIKSLDGRVEIENKGGKRVKLIRFLKLFV